MKDFLVTLLARVIVCAVITAAIGAVLTVLNVIINFMIWADTHGHPWQELGEALGLVFAGLFIVLTFFVEKENKK